MEQSSLSGHASLRSHHVGVTNNGSASTLFGIQEEEGRSEASSPTSSSRKKSLHATGVQGPFSPTTVQNDHPHPHDIHVDNDSHSGQQVAEISTDTTHDNGYYDDEFYDDDEEEDINPFCTTNSLRGDGYGGGTLRHRRTTSSSTAASTTAAAGSSSNNAFESHNYEPDESEVWRAHVAQMHFMNRGHWWTTGKKRAIKRWVLTFCIGVIQACLAAACNWASKTLFQLKFDQVHALMDHSVSSSLSSTVSSTTNNNNNNLDSQYLAGGDVDDLFQQRVDDAVEPEMHASSSLWGGSAFLAYMTFQLAFALVSALFVFLEPACAGSGISEIKCYLNGINLPRIMHVRTLACKVVGVVFSTAAGLPIGMEGPMVHVGSIVASAISQGKSQVCGVDTSCTKFSELRNDKEKRDFVACGAAAGICSAFGSPIGAVLFSLEEGASYWSTKLTWRAFFCAMTTLATLFWVRNVDTVWGQASIEKLFALGDFNSSLNGGEAANFSIWELVLFSVVGFLGGLIGAIFNAANERLTIWRMKRINFSKSRRMLEVLCVSVTMSIVSFVIPLLWGRCTELPSDMQDWNNQEKNLVDALVPFYCVPGKEYNEVASLYFTQPDVAIKQLFHFRESGADDTSTFSSGALFLFFVPYITMAMFTYGIAVPSGLFVPSLLSGAAFGRLFGHLLHKLDHTSGTFADSGTYALMGAAAVLGGMSRMTISLTVILLEATGNMQYVLPLMLTVMAARFTGNVFNDGIYEIHIALKHIPFLEPDVPPIAERNEIVAAQVMSTKVKCLRPVERAGVVFDLLRSCGHGNFPIVDTATGGTLYGTASRTMLATLLKRRAFGAPDVLEEYDDVGGGNQNLGPRRLSPLVQWNTIEKAYPKYPTIVDVEMHESERNCWLDLRPYANTAPYTINETASIQRTYRLFRTLGLRTLCVVNHTNQVVGIITRKDLLPESLIDSLLRGRNAHANDENEREIS